ncbi:unnamed protein product [Pleuronectes platessa]|uniref:Uncharacterized protein n=1 Tax=Pleuronectes platessa TaxID=8262 RepID=A0A9N7UZS4_PLEPL|nr:unnamed protein product [Pleuronectes platessa]
MSMVRDLDPDQLGRDIPEETMAEGRGSRYSSPPGGHRSSRPTQQQYRDRQPYVRRPQQYQDHRTYEPRPGPEGRHPDYPEQRGYSGAKRMVRDRYPDQRGRDILEEIMAEGREEQYHHRRPYVRPTQQYYEHRTYEPRPGPEGRHPDYPEQRGYSGAKRMVKGISRAIRSHLKPQTKE